jgi:hypothetical protein
MYRIIGADGRSYGPVGVDELRQWISEGRANSQSQLQVEGTVEWRPLSTFPEFAANLPSAAFVTPAILSTTTTSSTAAMTTNRLAIAGFVLGLLSTPSFCCCCGCFFGLPCSILGLIFSCMGLSQINKNPMQGGKGLAIAGIILSILGLLLALGFSIFGVMSVAQDPTFFNN